MHQLLVTKNTTNPRNMTNATDDENKQGRVNFDVSANFLNNGVHKKGLSKSHNV